VKNQHTFGVSIPVPCHENWDLMSPHEQGKYCMVCSKAVIDFTHMTDTEIIRAIQQSSQTICGRLDEQQLDSLRPKYQLPKKMKVFLYALAVAFLIELPSEVFAQTPSDTISSNLLQSGEINGRVTDEKGQPMDFATVQVFENDVKVGGAKTDINGRFKIKLINPGVYSVRVTYAGYQTETVKKVGIQPNKLTDLNFSLKKRTADQRPMTGVIVMKHKLIDPSEPNKKVMTKSELRNITR